MKIVFMGTPEFAVPALKTLLESAHELAAVYTQPPRPAKRGQKEQKSPIHILAEQNDIEVRTPVSLKSPEEQKNFSDINADIAVVVAYGLILPKAVLEAFPHGCINLHPSLLPRWRGAAPIQRSIMAGDTETGVCIIQLTEELDTGDILGMEVGSMSPGTTAEELHDKLAEIGGNLLLETLDKIEKGICSFTPQETEGVTYANKISKAEAKIDWNKSAGEIFNLIHGLSPYPGAYFEHAGARIKILKAEKSDASGKPGEVLDEKLSIACVQDSITPVLIQKQGKKVMCVEEFIKGNPIPVGTIL